MERGHGDSFDSPRHPLDPPNLLNPSEGDVFLTLEELGEMERAAGHFPQIVINRQLDPVIEESIPSEGEEVEEEALAEGEQVEAAAEGEQVEEEEAPAEGEPIEEEDRLEMVLEDIIEVPEQAVPEEILPLVEPALNEVGIAEEIGDELPFVHPLPNIPPRANRMLTIEPLICNNTSFYCLDNIAEGPDVNIRFPRLPNSSAMNSQFKTAYGIEPVNINGVNMYCVDMVDSGPNVENPIAQQELLLNENVYNFYMRHRMG